MGEGAVYLGGTVIQITYPLADYESSYCLANAHIFWGCRKLPTSPVIDSAVDVILKEREKRIELFADQYYTLLNKHIPQ